MNFSDINECVEQSPCDQNAQCTNSIGSFTCACNNGYRGDGLTCTGQYTPCLLNILTWTCRPGVLTLSQANPCRHFLEIIKYLLYIFPTLSDIDECQEQSPCGENAVCTNTPGSFTCACSEGYSGDGLICTGQF